MADKPACGKGLAGNSPLPAKLSALMASVAENLELHMKALDLKDKNARKEYKSYGHLAREHRNLAASLQAIAGEIEGYRGLATGKQDEEVLSDPKILVAFEKFMKAERDLIILLKKRMHRNSKMLSPRGHARRVG
jgi:hypothetical protein